MTFRHTRVILVIVSCFLCQWSFGTAISERAAGAASGHLSKDPSRSSTISAVNKCCPTDQALVSGKGCIRSSNPPSAYLTHLQNIMSVRVGFPVPREQLCDMMVLRRNVEHVATWWISRVGLLAVEAPQGELAIHNYCIDDLIDPASNSPSPSVVTCVHELNGEVQLPLSAFRSKTVGKCCARDQHFSRTNNLCQAGSEGIPDWEVPIPGADNETQLGYTGFPSCPSNKYFTYYFNNPLEDHVRLAPNLSLTVVSMDGHCIEKESVVNLKDYCFDYEWDGSGDAKPLAVMCVQIPDPEPYPERGPMLVVLLSISCIALVLTMAFLLALQRNNSSAQVPQSGPLAPRTHLTYVGTLLLSFLVLAVSITQDVEQGTSSCWATAGFLLFFLLAGFHWNTALCLESLLIIMRLGTPGWRRYLLHCCWAYGGPALITIIALSLDANRDSLPCGTITPRVGRYTCFFSDPDAQMLYLYLPVLLTLAANLLTLGVARHIRISRLRRLELGAKHNKRHGGSGGAGNGKNSNTLEEGVNSVEHRRPLSNARFKGSNSSIAKFGLSSQETQKLYWEAVCLGLWSGITWLMEVIGFAVTSYSYRPNGAWYEYLWYIPTAINSLRGVGVFFILVIIPKESRNYFVELVSRAWVKCGGKPIRRSTASTRRSSTSTVTTGTITAADSPVAAGDKERLSFSSSDTQLSSHAASMSELYEIPRQTDVISTALTANTASTSLSTKPGIMKNANGRSSSESQSNGNSHHAEIHKNASKSRSEEKLNDHYSKKTTDGFPIKPPRKSIDLTARTSMNVDNLSKSNQDGNENHTINLVQAPQTPPKTPSPTANNKKDSKLSSRDVRALTEGAGLPLNSDSSPDTPPDSSPPTPPTSPPPAIADEATAPLGSASAEKNVHLPPFWTGVSSTESDCVEKGIDNQQNLTEVADVNGSDGNDSLLVNESEQGVDVNKHDKGNIDVNNMELFKSENVSSPEEVQLSQPRRSDSSSGLTDRD